MAGPTVTLILPETVYAELRQRALNHRRRLEDEAATIIAAIDGEGAPPLDLAAVTAIAALDEDGLWRVSQSRPTEEDTVLLDVLVAKRRRQGTTPDEDRLVAELVDRLDRVMALRAEAIALLHQRGADVAERVARA